MASNITVNVPVNPADPHSYVQLPADEELVTRTAFLGWEPVAGDVSVREGCFRPGFAFSSRTANTLGGRAGAAQAEQRH